MSLLALSMIGLKACLSGTQGWLLAADASTAPYHLLMPDLHRTEEWRATNIKRTTTTSA